MKWREGGVRESRRGGWRRFFCAPSLALARSRSLSFHAARPMSENWASKSHHLAASSPPTHTEVKGARARRAGEGEQWGGRGARHAHTHAHRWRAREMRARASARWPTSRAWHPSQSVSHLPASPSSRDGRAGEAAAGRGTLLLSVLSHRRLSLRSLSPSPLLPISSS